MNKLNPPTPGLIRQLPRFGSIYDSLTEEDRKTLINQSFVNADLYEKGIAGTVENQHFLSSVRKRVLETKKELSTQKIAKASFWFRRVLNTLTISAMFYGTGYVFSEGVKSKKGAGEGLLDSLCCLPFIALTGAIPLFLFNTCPKWSKRHDFKDIQIIASSLKKQIALVQRIEKEMIQIEATPDDFISQRMDSILSQKITWAAGKLANRLLRVYDMENSSARPHFDRIFGGRESMPNERQIENLFKYYSIQSIQAEQRLDGSYQSLHLKSGRSVPTSAPKITREAFLSKTYALMKAAMQTGEIYHFVMKDENNPLYEQTYNQDMAGMINAVQAQVHQEMAGIRKLFIKSIEIDQYIHKSTHLLVSLQLSHDPTDSGNNPEIHELEAMIKRLNEKQNKIRAMIGEDSPNIMVAEEDLAIIRAEALSALDETKAFLAELDYLIPNEQKPGEETALNALKRQGEADLTQGQKAVHKAT